jgi:hypothetical protein
LRGFFGTFTYVSVVGLGTVVALLLLTCILAILYATTAVGITVGVGIAVSVGTELKVVSAARIAVGAIASWKRVRVRVTRGLRRAFIGVTGMRRLAYTNVDCNRERSE